MEKDSISKQGGNPLTLSCVSVCVEGGGKRRRAIQFLIAVPASQRRNSSNLNSFKCMKIERARVKKPMLGNH